MYKIYMYLKYLMVFVISYLLVCTGVLVVFITLNILVLVVFITLNILVLAQGFYVDVLFCILLFCEPWLQNTFPLVGQLR